MDFSEEKERKTEIACKERMKEKREKELELSIGILSIFFWVDRK